MNDLILKTEQAVELLKKLISIPAFSKEEDKRVEYLTSFFEIKNVSVNRVKNNIWLKNKYYDKSKNTILLATHTDTVKPNSHYTSDPFIPREKDGKIFGLGSNDAGASIVSMVETFMFFFETKNLKYNLVLALVAEEEISGANGIELILNEIENLNCAIVGEPTQMQLAIAERGLLVLDCEVSGKSGHAAREEGENAILKSLQDINWFSTFKFPKQSEILDSVKMTVTQINAGIQHNIIPEKCSFTVDIRFNELYTIDEILNEIKKNVSCKITPRSKRNRSSIINTDHPLVKAGISLNLKTYGSPTSSDKSLIPVPTLKMGPGNSSRSHTADEFVYIDEIKNGIEIYSKLLKLLLI